MTNVSLNAAQLLAQLSQATRTANTTQPSELDLLIAAFNPTNKSAADPFAGLGGGLPTTTNNGGMDPALMMQLFALLATSKSEKSEETEDKTETTTTKSEPAPSAKEKTFTSEDYVFSGVGDSAEKLKGAQTIDSTTTRSILIEDDGDDDVYEFNGANATIQVKGDKGANTYNVNASKDGANKIEINNIGSDDKVNLRGNFEEVPEDELPEGEKGKKGQVVYRDKDTGDLVWVKTDKGRDAAFIKEHVHIDTSSATSSEKSSTENKTTTTSTDETSDTEKPKTQDDKMSKLLPFIMMMMQQQQASQQTTAAVDPMAALLGGGGVTTNPGGQNAALEAQLKNQELQRLLNKFAQGGYSDILSSTYRYMGGFQG